MTDREAFEAWMKSEHPRYDPTDDTVNIRRFWNCWNAATMKERERAEKLLQSELDHAAANDTRLVAAPGRIKGDQAVRASYVSAVIDAIRKGS